MNLVGKMLWKYKSQKGQSRMSQKHSVYYINTKKSSAGKELAHLLEKCIEKLEQPYKELVLLCIGSDRITGDSLGPLIGHQLERYHWNDVYVYGTLHAPVHALNLNTTMEELKRKHPSAVFIAIDASLGSKKHIGFITVGTGPIYPGAGVRKNLLPVGDIFITGILNESGCFEHLLLQTTRLSFVVEMAEIITEGIVQTLYHKLENHRLLPEQWFQSETESLSSHTRDNDYAALSIESVSGSVS